MDAQTDAALSRASANSLVALAEEVKEVEDLKNTATHSDSATLQTNWSELLVRLDSKEPLTTQDMLLIAHKVATDGTLESNEKDQLNEKLSKFKEKML